VTSGKYTCCDLYSRRDSRHLRDHIEAPYCTRVKATQGLHSCMFRLDEFFWCGNLVVWSILYEITLHPWRCLGRQTRPRPTSRRMTSIAWKGTRCLCHAMLSDQSQPNGASAAIPLKRGRMVVKRKNLQNKMQEKYRKELLKVPWDRLLSKRSNEPS
jgi:hypothetical protein